MYNLEPNLVDKFTKLNELGFSNGSLIADNFPAQLLKMFILGTGWALGLSSKSFRDFLEIFF